MTPGARIAATIEILEKIERSGSPADEVVSAYMRGRRYIGSKDRRAINTRLFDSLRRRARLDYHLEKEGGETLPRLRVLADLLLSEQLSLNEIGALFDGQGYAPQQLGDGEKELVKKLSGKFLLDPEMPEWIQAETPEWLWPQLSVQWGERTSGEMAALNDQATMDLRVNTLKADCGRALEVLKKDNVEAEPTSYSPIGLRVKKRVNLQATTAFRSGFVEIQDEGAQLVALLCDAIANHKCVDFCAGGGGKSLALAAQMKDGGPLLACDTDHNRLDRMKPRLKRAGASNVTRHYLQGDDESWIVENANTAERVLVDIPCSGTGAWRRNPAAKWRLTPEKLDDLVELQRQILTQAASLVAPGGRLIYATCSVLPQENIQQIDWFLAQNSEFTTLPIADIWRQTIGTNCPVEGVYLEITPARHGTDGFFSAILEKKT